MVKPFDTVELAWPLIKNNNGLIVNVDYRQYRNLCYLAYFAVSFNKGFSCLYTIYCCFIDRYFKGAFYEYKS